MPDTPTPGQIARAAYWRILAPQYGDLSMSIEALHPLHQAAWEAAAQAVLESQATLCPICNAELERCNAEDSP